MPSIAGFIQSLLSEDMYATGMLEKMDERISQLNAGQLKLLVSFVENKVPGLTNKTVLDAYTKLLRKATVETDKRHEEEMRGERERLIKLKAAHAGVNAKAWDTSHASLDRELAKFQKFLKSKARRVAEEAVLQEEMEKLQRQLLALPARRVAADTKKHTWWAFGAVLVVVVGPILILSLLPVGTLVAVGAFLAACALAAGCWFVGVLRGIVVVPTLDDDAIEEKTRKRARETLKGYRAEVRRTFEATEKIFAADMKWRDEWVESRKRERRNERRKAKKTPKEGGEESAGGQQEESVKHSSGGRIFPEEEEEERRGGPGREPPKTEDCGGGSERAAEPECDTGRGRRLLEGEQGKPSSADLSGADRHHDPEDDDRARDGEEGLLARPLGEQTIPENDVEAPPPRGEPAGTTSLGARRRSTRSNGWRRTWRRSTFISPKHFAALEEGKGDGGRAPPGEGRTRGPCQGSGPLDVSKQGSEKHQSRQDLLGVDPPASVSNVDAMEEGTSSLVSVPAPGQETEGVVEGHGAPGRAEGHPDRTAD